MENKTALIIGATGLVGKFCLSYLLNENAYARVIAISRKPIGFAHAKLENIVCDFDQLEKHQAEIKADDIYCCLGTTIAVAGSREAFTKVDLAHFVQQTNPHQEQQELNTDLFENALSLPDIKVRKCLVPRTEIVGVEKLKINEPSSGTSISEIILYETL